MRLKSFKVFESLNNFQHDVETCVDSFMEDYDFRLVLNLENKPVWNYHNLNPIMQYVSFGSLDDNDDLLDCNEKLFRDLVILNRKLKDKNLTMYITVHQANSNAVYYEFGEDMSHEQSSAALLSCNIQGEESNDAYRFGNVKDFFYRYFGQKILLEILITTI